MNKTKCKYCEKEFSKYGIKNHIDIIHLKVRETGAKGKIAWNKGLTKETDERVAKLIERSREAKKGKIPWNKGLTKETDERVKRTSEKQKLILGENTSNFGKKFSEEHKRKMKASITKSKNGGFKEKNIVSYEYHSKLLENFHEFRNDNDILETKCTYCGKWYKPRYNDFFNRKRDVYEGRGGSNFYCSNNCKLNCPTYGKSKYSLGFAPATSREVQPELRKLVFLRDNYQCTKCIGTNNLHCHHIDPVINNPIESADIDNCITLCKSCHMMVHKLPGCKNGELRC
jgi:5-methylcytosine-specific restriction endonuclease McrA